VNALEIEFYWRPGCGFCSALRRPLMASGLPVREINIWEESGAAERVREVAGGNETVPTVIVGSRAMVNPSFAEIEAAVRAEAPELLCES
jgi:glutaredoxin